MQKIRCNPDLENPEGSDCLTCQNINLESKKVIHRLPCLRWKLGEVVMFRDGGLGLTTRWHGLKMKDLGPRDWTYPNDPPRKIVVTIGCKRQPIELLVRRFKLIHGDITHKGWIDKNGVQRRIEIPPYALASIHETVKQYKKYVFCNARIAIDEYAHKEGVDPLVQKTYAAALEYAIELEQQHPSPANGDDVNPSVFLNQYFSLWFAVRNTLGSSFIVGDDTLDMEPVKDEDCPYRGTVSIPRMIPVQFDSLGYLKLLAPWRKLVLEGLWKMTASKNPNHFYLIYLTVFMMLHEVSFNCADRKRRARENSLNRPYDLLKFVEEVQEGANIILSHWHYYKRDVNEMEIESEEKKKAVWGSLSSQETQLIVETRQAYKERAADRTLEPMTWEHDLMFVSQMFEENWEPKDTFRR
ncbi:uncharacterized protein F4822DRAFT_393208 [Hypoxylon trugodes]|uniref:uncharacterized protein n=1 Tax=Hypoxylon trugodes TaxID=326681 RepID=UPI002191C48C|nr:uncharacterized protein F4822DRAFT_393208 [Hypoxylon trugodes]KAI1390458.1 hypothetical protein F4822DRAFT_393208 [Hypoxylon trugodes]